MAKRLEEAAQTRDCLGEAKKLLLLEGWGTRGRVFQGLNMKKGLFANDPWTGGQDNLFVMQFQPQ